MSQDTNTYVLSQRHVAIAVGVAGFGIGQNMSLILIGSKVVENVGLIEMLQSNDD